jgi:hypothetical protein
VALSLVKNIAIKIKKLFTEIYIAIFSGRKLERGSQLINLQSAQNKIYLVAAVTGWQSHTGCHFVQLAMSKPLIRLK